MAESENGLARFCDDCPLGASYVGELTDANLTTAADLAGGLSVSAVDRHGASSLISTTTRDSLYELYQLYYPPNTAAALMFRGIIIPGTRNIDGFRDEVVDAIETHKGTLVERVKDCRGSCAGKCRAIDSNSLTAILKKSLDD